MFEGHKSDVQKAIFHPNLHYVITASQDRTVIMWKMEDASMVRAIPLPVSPLGSSFVYREEDSPVRALITSRCGKYIIAGSKFFLLNF